MQKTPFLCLNIQNNADCGQKNIQISKLHLLTQIEILT